MKWYYQIEGSAGKVLEKSRAIYDSQDGALAAGCERAKEIGRAGEVTSIIAAQAQAVEAR